MASWTKICWTLGGQPESGVTLLARQLFARVLACPGGMRIQTIHAFAQEILKRFPLEAGLPPHFTVMEEAALPGPSRRC